VQNISDEFGMIEQFPESDECVQRRDMGHRGNGFVARASARRGWLSSE